MGFLSKILGREKTPTKVESVPTECLHAILVPHWDSISDMGKEDLATSYTCQSCNQSFTPEEAKAQRQKAFQRLQNV
jgi:hypothetical protein